MLTTEIFKESFSSLLQNKGRTFLSVLGIVIGIASVITMTAIGAGSQQTITDQIETLGTNILTVSPRGWSNSSGFTQTELDTILANNYQDLFAAISPEVSTSETLVYEDTEESTTITGVTSGYFDTRNKTVALGRKFTTTELENAEKVVIIGNDTAETFFDTAQNALEKKIKIGSSSYQIIGVLKASGSSSSSSADSLALLPLKTVQQQLTGTNVYSTFAFSLHKADDLEKAKSVIGYTLLDLHGLESVDDADFRMMSSTDLLETLTSVTETFTLLLAGIAGISLLVGGIGIMNVMLMSVLERTREIGLRKALGAKKKYLIMQFLFEAVLITVIGGLVGLLLGIAASKILSYFFDFSTSISTGSVLMAIGVSTAIGLIFGIYPANKASKLQPIEALRSD